LLALPASAKYLSIEPLFEEELLLALPAGHPLCDQPKISAKDISNERFVLLGSTHCLVGAIESFCNRKNFQPVTTSKIEQLSTVQHLVALGHGLSFVPKIATGDDLGGKLVYRSLNRDKPTRKIAICWNPYRYQSQLLSNFIKAIIEFAGSEFIASIETIPTKRAKSSRTTFVPTSTK
jgi:LysR family hydrogen peroxide-inducible transcriptional activator